MILPKKCVFFALKYINPSPKYIFLREKYINREKKYVFPSLIYLFRRVIYLSGRRIQPSSPRSWSPRRKRTRSVSEGQQSGSLGKCAKADTLALAHASGSFPPWRPRPFPLPSEPRGHRDDFLGGHCREQKRGCVEKAVRPHGRPNRAVAPRQNAQTGADKSRDNHAQTALVDVA